MGEFLPRFYFKCTVNSGEMFMYQSLVSVTQDMANFRTAIWDAWCIFPCLMFLTINNETVTHYLVIICVQWKEQICFVKQYGYTYCITIILCEKMFCFKRSSNFKTQAVSFILRLLIKLVYSFISQNTKKSQFLSKFDIVFG